MSIGCDEWSAPWVSGTSRAADRWEEFPVPMRVDWSGAWLGGCSLRVDSL